MCLVILSNRYSQDLVIKWERRKDVEKLRKELKRKSFENLSLIFVCRNAASHLADEWTARSLYFSFYFFFGWQNVLGCMLFCEIYGRISAIHFSV